MKRAVVVPFAGHVIVEIDDSIEVSESHGWDEPTEFERAALDVAWTYQVAITTPEGEAPIEWDVQFLHKISAGNLLLAEVNEIGEA